MKGNRYHRYVFDTKFVSEAAHECRTRFPCLCTHFPLVLLARDRESVGRFPTDSNISIEKKPRVAPAGYFSFRFLANDARAFCNRARVAVL